MAVEVLERMDLKKLLESYYFMHNLPLQITGHLSRYSGQNGAVWHRKECACEPGEQKTAGNSKYIRRLANTCC